MRYRDAKRLHNEDEIIVRKTGESHTVVNVDVRISFTFSVKTADVTKTGRCGNGLLE